ncbi:hypothetical protein KC19_3G151500 [Ceratodon purpureus]|uniref:Polygalacturonase n=1 Tax=Ceratodon purpureus TaxID=3225 RepID=A0A8T0IKU3_CERPU|nr:hypothetical protein KC19_3G151500 [Ceratodon purpureus]
MTFKAMIPHGNQSQAFKCRLIIALILAFSLAICSHARSVQRVLESILDPDDYESSTINHVESGQFMKPTGFEARDEIDHFDEESATSFGDFDTLFWHRFDEELSVEELSVEELDSVGLYDGASEEEIAPAPSAGSDWDEDLSPGSSGGSFDEELAPGPSGGYTDAEFAPGPSAGYSQRASRNRFDVRYPFGAKGDGITNDTDAFLAAWKMACTVTSGEVYIPSGFNFLVYPSTFTGPCKEDLHFSLKGNILAPMEISAWAGRNVGQWLVFENLNNFTLSGGGTFNGRGQNWWACKRNETCQRAPNAVTIYKSSNVTARYVNFLDSAQMHINFQYVHSGHAKALQIQAPWSSPNTDGIHISGTTDFTIQKCNISTGDDCVSIVSGSHNIEVQDTYCGKGCHGISIGSLGANGEHANVTQVQVKNCQMESTTNGLRVKTWQGGTGIARNFEFRNIQLTNVSNPIIIDQYYCPPSQTREACTNQTDNVHIDLVKFTNIWGTSASAVAVKLACSESVPCTNIRLKDINITRVNGGSARSTCTDAFGTAQGIQIPPSCIPTNSSSSYTLSLASPFKLLQQLWHIFYLEI